MKRYQLDELPVKKSLLEETPIHGELNIEQIVFRLMEHTNVSASQDELIFASYVRLLMSYLPGHKRASVYERETEYMDVKECWHYKYNCGVPLGTPEEPINGSPYKVEETVIDWHKLFEIIVQTYEDCGLTWKFDKWTIEAGKVEDTKNVQPTPVFASDFVAETQTEQGTVKPEQPSTYTHVCAVCNQPIMKGEGKIFKHKRVHKKGCLDIAKTKWINEPD